MNTIHSDVINGFHNSINLRKKKLISNPFEDWKHLSGYFGISEDPDEMAHFVVFHKGLHSLLSQNRASKKDIQFFGGRL